MEADLAREYGVDLLDLWRDGSSLDWRRLRILVKGLPAEGTALAREAQGPAGQWTTADWLLERIANAVADGVWAFFEINRDRKQQPTPIPRPQPIELPRKRTDLAAPGPKLTPSGKRIASNEETLRILSRAIGSPG